MSLAYSFADQALAVGGGFLANVALARTQSKEEYGLFVLSYSVYTFLFGLHQAAIIEPYTVYGSGRYRERFSEYLRLMTRTNVLVGLLLSGILLLTCLLLFWIAPQVVSRSLVGLSLTVGVLLSGAFVRRAFYVQRRAALAAKTSLVFFFTVACGLMVTVNMHLLNSFTVFVILALGWIAAGAAVGRNLAFGKPQEQFLEMEPQYWREHWRYSKWLLATAFIFQFTYQGYYWLVAGFLSVKEVADLKAIYMLVTPVEQVFVALSYLILPVLASHYAGKRRGSFLSLWKRYGCASVAVTGLFALAVRFLGKQVMHVLYAGKYDGLAPFLFVLALLPLVMGIGNTINNALSAMEKPSFVFWAFLSSGAATFLVGIPLVAHFGLWGAVYGMLFSGGTYTAALAIGFLLSVYSKVPRPELI
jgi:O-antigen/teichoic acid export membrane protein